MELLELARKEEARASGGGGGSSSGGGGSSSKGKGKAQNDTRLVQWGVGIPGQAAVALSIATEGSVNSYGGLPRCLLMHT